MMLTSARASYPRFFFLHVLTIITLYASVVGMLMLLFQYINVLFPDPLSFYLQGILDTIRWSEAMLIILFPVFILSVALIQREIGLERDLAEARIRRWLLTLTVFLAALIVISDLVTLVYNFLSGDLTARFLLKVLAVLIVALAVFSYEFWELRQHDARMGARRTIAIIVAIIVLFTIVVGFFIVGSPMQQRRVRSDERRVSELQMLQGQIVDRWMRTDRLPATLNDLESAITGFSVPMDPRTGEPYEYRAMKPLTFELCATFETGSGEQRGPSPSMPLSGKEHWEHGEGRACFERTIDPKLYPDRPGRPK